MEDGTASLFGLAPSGVYRVPVSPSGLVRSYRTVSPLPGTVHGGHPFRAWTWRFVFCGTFLRVTPTGRYPAPCSAEPGLSSPHLTTGGDHLAFFFLEKGVARRRAVIGIWPSNALAPVGLNDWHPVTEHGTFNPTAAAGPCATPCPARAVKRGRVVGLRVWTKTHATCHGLGWRMGRTAATEWKVAD